MALSIIGYHIANELSSVCTMSILRGIINVTSRIVKDGMIFYEKGFEQPTNSGKFDKEGKDKKSINAQNIVNAFAYMNLRNITTKRTNVF